MPTPNATRDPNTDMAGISKNFCNLVGGDKVDNGMAGTRELSCFGGGVKSPVGSSTMRCSQNKLYSSWR